LRDNALVFLYLFLAVMGCSRKLASSQVNPLGQSGQRTLELQFLCLLPVPTVHVEACDHACAVHDTSY
jgi:hypothetical protein